jgi:hypothetical protein
MIEAVRTSETSVDNHFTRQYNPEDSSEQNTKIFNTVRTQDYFITNIIVKMDTVGLTRERYNSGFLNVKSDVVASTPMLYRVNVSLDSFTVFSRLLCCDKFLDHQQIGEIWNV